MTRPQQYTKVHCNTILSYHSFLCLTPFAFLCTACFVVYCLLPYVLSAFHVLSAFLCTVCFLMYCAVGEVYIHHRTVDTSPDLHVIALRSGVRQGPAGQSLFLLTLFLRDTSGGVLGGGAPPGGFNLTTEGATDGADVERGEGLGGARAEETPLLVFRADFREERARAQSAFHVSEVLDALPPFGSVFGKASSPLTVSKVVTVFLRRGLDPTLFVQ